MALYDNKYWLLSHIRNSFISSDDTGMCELVMASENKDVKQHLSRLESYPEPEESESEEDDFGSCDYPIEVNFGIRERSNTAAQLEKLDQARKKAAKMRHIKWELNKEISKTDLEDLFVKKTLAKKSVKADKPKSLFSELMKNSSNVPRNPYIEFAKFDGSGQVNIPIKKYKIFLTMLPPQQRNYPMSVTCVASARILELIGLILLKYSSQHGIHNLLPVTQYGLYITEEDGEVDRDFPCLDPREPISKFGFICLGLVEHKEHFKSVSFPEEGLLVSPIEETHRTRTLSDKSKAEETRQMENDIQAIEKHNKLMEAPLYKSFRVFMVTKVKRKIEVNIGISGERIEIDPVPQKTSKLMPFKQKAVSHSIECIQRCDVTEKKNTKTCFRLVYIVNDSTPSTPTDVASTGASSYSPSSQLSLNLKHYDFESDVVMAQDIVNKIKLILELRANSSRSDYKTGREKKFIKKKSFTLIK